MKLVSATVYKLRLPFVESFTHAMKERAFSDSIVVMVRDECGGEGFGEGAPRPYVTGESQATAVMHLCETLWPSVAGRQVELLAEPYGRIPELIPDAQISGAISDGASRCALELAMLDLSFRRRAASIGRLIPPRRHSVIYSGVISAGSLDGVERRARQLRLIGIEQVKVKVGGEDDLDRVRRVREIMGPTASIRLDVNGAWDFDRAVSTAHKLAPLQIAALEQPVPRTTPYELALLRRCIPIPLMADESLVTIADARRLIELHAVDYFNLRVSKCGGLARSLEIARLAQLAGIKLQVGSQVGETAILSAAGRHLAATLDSVDFVEGSYGTMLLAEDVTTNPIRFGHRGLAPTLTGPGLGIKVIEDRLRKYATETLQLN